MWDNHGMRDVLDLTAGLGSFQWMNWESGQLIDLMKGGEVVGHLRILLAVRRYPQCSMRLYCERVSGG